ncbi:MAG: hypothetical protein AABW84_00850 [Nanoarchaeota archaeon]
MATLTLQQVEKKLTYFKEDLNAKRDYLNKLLDDIKDNTDLKDLEKDVKSQLTQDILKGKPVSQYSLSYDSFGISLEPMYYWFIDSLKDPTFGIGYDVEKVKDTFAAAEASAFYGELGRRRTELEKRAGELMGTINMVVKSILNLIYDLKEFELRLDEYSKLHSDEYAVSNGADYALKTIWLTEVDSKKGPGSINALVQNLNYIMVRDAFFSVYIPVGKADDVEKIVLKKIQDELDIPDMVKRILQGRIKEYILWREMSERELRKRYKIERTYLKSQVSSMKMYSEWARPYLIATRKLLPQELKAEDMADLPIMFNTMITYIDILAKKQIKSSGELKDLKVRDENKVFSIIEIKFLYRVLPGGQTQEGYRGHTGKVTININGYVMQKKDLDNLEKVRQDEIMNFIDIGTKDTLDAISDDLKRFLEEEAEKKEEKKSTSSFGKTIYAVKQKYESVREQVQKVADIVNQIAKFDELKYEDWNVAKLQKEGEKKVKRNTDILYMLFKRAHGMLGWPIK